MQAITRAATITLGLLLSLVAGYLGYKVVRSDLAAGVYRQRLADVSKDYETLRRTYNDAVRRSAVTELVVKDGAMSVRVSTPQGVVKEIPAPFDPRGEIYVDYVLVEGRLLIRRVFDSTTPPARALVVDPGLGTVDWDAPGAAHGTCVYRRLGEGRWVVSVSGDGALGLTKSDDSPAALVNAPEVRSHERIEEEVRQEIDRISARDVWRWITGASPAP